MKPKRFAFVMDPLDELDLPWDTSLCLLRELNRQGHLTYLFTPSRLFLLSSQVGGKGRSIRPLGNHRYHAGPEQKFFLADFDVVFIRKDPPFDSSYLSLTYLLESVAAETWVINHPRGIRNANEKLFGLRFARWSPPTLVSSDADEIIAFQEKIRSDLVIKPLYDKGGKGVFLLSRKKAAQKKGGRPLLRKATRRETEPVVVQKFIALPQGTGDKRILLWKGEILGGFERIPRGGEFRSNLSLGGRFVPCRITEGEKRLVRELRPVLFKEGLLFVGIDVRRGFLIEVNVTSPAGLVELDQLYGREMTAGLARASTPNERGQLPSLR